jgi:hypothetical protein
MNTLIRVGVAVMPVQCIGAGKPEESEGVLVKKTADQK